jgi:tellurite resistance protein TerB
MGFFSSVNSAVNTLSSKFDGEISKWKNKDAAYASLAIVALTAAVDGEIEPEERKAGTDFVRKSDIFKAFDRNDLAVALESYYMKATNDILKEDVFDVIRKVKGTDAAGSVVRVGIGIAKADGEMEPAEVEILREVCDALGLDPGAFKGLR